METNDKKTPVLAVCYDFDRTLTPEEMQAQGYIQSVGCDVRGFWDEANALAVRNDMDGNLAYMYLMVKKAIGSFPLTRAVLEKYGADVKLFRGVESWFDRIDAYAEEYGINTEHYIISSGLKEMIEGTTVAKRGVFRKIYASSFYFDETGEARWPAQVINYTNKTQFLFRIEKGVTDINDDRVNEFFPPEKLRVPFENIVYIGDSITDVPCMKLVNSHGGYAVGVYDPDTGDRSRVDEMLRANRIKYAVPADYSKGGEMENLIKNIIRKTAEKHR